MMGGDISVEPGRGSTFTIQIVEDWGAPKELGVYESGPHRTRNGEVSLGAFAALHMSAAGTRRR